MKPRPGQKREIRSTFWSKTPSLIIQSLVSRGTKHSEWLITSTNLESHKVNPCSTRSLLAWLGNLYGNQRQKSKNQSEAWPPAVFTVSHIATLACWSSGQKHKSESGQDLYCLILPRKKLFVCILSLSWEGRVRVVLFPKLAMNSHTSNGWKSNNAKSVKTALTNCQKREQSRSLSQRL
jgi:hypothetical protein